MIRGGVMDGRNRSVGNVYRALLPQQKGKKKKMGRKEL